MAAKGKIAAPKDGSSDRATRKRRQAFLGISLYNGLSLSETTERIRCIQSVETVDLLLERCFTEVYSEAMAELCQAIGALQGVRTLRVRSASFKGRLVPFPIPALVSLLQSRPSDSKENVQQSTLTSLQLTCLELAAPSGRQDVDSLALALETCKQTLVNFQVRSCAFRCENQRVDSSHYLDPFLEALGKLPRLERIQLQASAMGYLGEVSDSSFEAVFSSTTLQSLSLESIPFQQGQVAVISRTLHNKYSDRLSQLKTLILNTPIYSYNDDEELPLANLLRGKCCRLEELDVQLYSEESSVGVEPSFSTRNLLMDLIHSLEVNGSVKKLSVTLKGYNKYNKISSETLLALIHMLQHKNVTLESLVFHRKTTHFIPKHQRRQIQFYLSLNKCGLRRRLLKEGATLKEWADGLASNEAGDLNTIYYLLLHQPAILPTV